jgi:hypothetical protein
VTTDGPGHEADHTDSADIAYLVPNWASSAMNEADHLQARLEQAPSDPIVTKIVNQAILRARYYAGRPCIYQSESRLPWLGRPLRRFADWWTGRSIDRAWGALHGASHELLMIEEPDVVQSRIPKIAASVVTALTPGDLRIGGYLKTLEILAQTGVPIGEPERAQLRTILATCDDASDSAHADARSFRNTQIISGLLLTAVLLAIAGIGWADTAFRSVFAQPHTVPNPGYVFEIELVASLSGLTAAVLALRNYTGFQYTYGLPFVQALLKASTGAATGLFGVLLVQNGIISTLRVQTGAGIFVIAVIFGYAQYLFTRLLDQKAQNVLGTASSQNDPAITPRVPAGGTALNLVPVEHAP